MPKNTPPTKLRVPFNPLHLRARYPEHGAWASKHIDGRNFDMSVLADECGVSYETMAGIRRGFSEITPEVMPVLVRAFGEPYDLNALAEWHRAHDGLSASAATSDAFDSNGTAGADLEDKLVQLILEVVPMLATSRQLALKRQLGAG